MEISGTTKKVIGLTVNNKEYKVEVSANETLLEVLREKLHLTGAKRGCDQGECGTCTVLVNDQPMLSCLLLAMSCEGKDISTIEGMADPKSEKLHPIQQAFIDHGGLQCGFCTPGIILTAKALLDKNISPSDQEIRESINGNICRCTGYISIIESISAAAERMRKEGR